MSVSFDGINKGDTVRIEFAAPLKGWVEGEVVDNDGGLRLLMESSGSFSVYYDEIGSITVIEPPLKPGDSFIHDNQVFTLDTTLTPWRVAYGLGAMGVGTMTIGMRGIPDGAVWLVRGGKLTDRVKQ